MTDEAKLLAQALTRACFAAGLSMQDGIQALAVVGFAYANEAVRKGHADSRGAVLAQVANLTASTWAEAEQVQAQGERANQRAASATAQELVSKYTLPKK